DIEILNIPQAVEDKQIRRVENFKQKRNSAKARNALETLGRAADSNENLVSLILDAVEARATLGEIIETLKGKFGVYQERKFI
ncbi:MAG: methylmalonyl-CoA mutase family protein, partial [bacterium]